MKFLLSAFLLLICTSTCPQSNCWRGITPLRSSCEDIKRILQVDACSEPISWYTLPDYRVMVEFAATDCDKFPRSYRVPKGTVVAMAISPQHPTTVSQFGIDLSKFKKREGEEIVGLEHYDNDDQGMSVELFKGYLLTVFLAPRKSDDVLRCKSAK